MEGSPVHCTIDLDGPGKQVGRLEVPRSTNSSGWSHMFVPIITISLLGLLLNLGFNALRARLLIGFPEER